MTIKIGLYNENFKMTSPEMLEEKLVQVRGYNSTFKIIAGPLNFEGQQLKNTYVLEIEYKESENAHAAKLPLNGWNSYLLFDYAEAATKLAIDFCEKNNLIVNNHLNSWPQFQAIVSKKQK